MFRVTFALLFCGMMLFGCEKKPTTIEPKQTNLAPPLDAEKVGPKGESKPLKPGAKTE